MTTSDGRRSGRLGKHELALLDILIKRAREKGFGPHDVVQFPGDVLDAVTDAATQVANAVTDAATSAAEAATAAAHDAADSVTRAANTAADAATQAVHAITDAVDRADIATAREQLIFPVTDIVDREISLQKITAQGGLADLVSAEGRATIAALAEQLQHVARLPAPTLGELIAVRDLARTEARKMRGKATKDKRKAKPKRGGRA